MPCYTGNRYQGRGWLEPLTGRPLMGRLITQTPNVITRVLTWEGHTQGQHLEKHSASLCWLCEWEGHEPRNSGGFQHLEKAKKNNFSPGASGEEHSPAHTCILSSESYFRVVAFRAATQ